MNKYPTRRILNCYSLSTICSRKGFTLVEIIAALTIMTVGLLGVLALFPVGMSASKHASNLNIASMFAQQQIDSIRAGRNSYLTDGQHSYPPPGAAFGVHPTFSWAAITSLTTVSNLYKVSLAIYWQDIKGEDISGTKYSYEDFVTYIADYQ